jgi:hypothetical protein
LKMGLLGARPTTKLLSHLHSTAALLQEAERVSGKPPLQHSATSVGDGERSGTDRPTFFPPSRRVWSGLAASKESSYSLGLGNQGCPPPESLGPHSEPRGIWSYWWLHSLTTSTPALDICGLCRPKQGHKAKRSFIQAIWWVSWWLVICMKSADGWVA